MDDPWADPWDDSKKPAPAAVPAWGTPPSLSTDSAQQPVSSWGPQETASWTAPAAQPDPQPSWGGEDSWSSPQSTLSGSANAPIALHTEDDDEDHSTPDTTASPVSPVEPAFAAPLPIGTPSRTLTPLKEPQDLDADGFGGFETGLDSATEDNPGWLPESDPFSDTKAAGGDVWGTTWGGTASEEEEEESSAAQPDEWEAARLQKEEQDKQKQEQDKHVPPELLDHILAQFKELSAELWKDDAQNSDPSESGHRMYDPQVMNLLEDGPKNGESCTGTDAKANF
ncbi:hypothetical protein MD484_g879, partial [Candolleomyces efflorescens]